MVANRNETARAAFDNAPDNDTPSPSFVHREGEEIFSDLINAYDQSLNRSLDWNGDTLRMLIAAILDVGHLSNPELDAAETRTRNERKARERLAFLPGATPSSVGFVPAASPSADEIAASMIAQLRAEGLVSKVDPQTAAFFSASPSDEPDETIPEPETRPLDDDDAGEVYDEIPAAQDGPAPDPRRRPGR